MSVESKLARVRSIVFFWEAPDRSMLFRIGTEDRRIIDAPQGVLQGCAESPIEGIFQAWRMDASNLTRDPKLGYLQVAFERDANPVELWHKNDKRWTKAEISKLARENRERAKTITYRKTNRDMVVYIMMAIALMIVLATGFVLLTSRIDFDATLKALPVIGKWFGGK
jgi:hypothetical protein